jgi:hypothetical protein
MPYGLFVPDGPQYLSGWGTLGNYSMSRHYFVRSFGSIDHHEARVFHFSPTDVERLVLHSDRPTEHIHNKANSIGSGHVSEDHAFLQRSWTPARFSLWGRPILNPSSSSTSANMILD